MRVGTRIFISALDTKPQDHPHACGDKDANKTLAIFDTGSSPCVWGQDCCKYNFNPILRIIPMRVGTRWLAVIQQAVNEDHPHACGDKEEKQSVKAGITGSSPCVWGQECLRE